MRIALPEAGLKGQNGGSDGGEKAERPPKGGLFHISTFRDRIGAGDEIRTHDPNLGKVMLYP
jgi:hypothetical protein